MAKEKNKKKNIEKDTKTTSAEAKDRKINKTDSPIITKKTASKKKKEQEVTKPKEKKENKVKEIEEKKNKADKRASKLLGLEKKPKKRKLLKSQKLKKIKKPKLKKSGIVTKISGRFFDSNEKQIAKLKTVVEEIRKEEKKLEKLSQEKLIEKTKKLQEKLQKDLSSDVKIFTEKNKAWLETKQGSEVLDSILEVIPEAFALVSEAIYRITGKRLFNVQLMGGIAIAQGRVIEFKTGEGKTYVGPLAMFTYSLFGRGANLVTVNDYLAKAHGEYMGHVMNYLGLTVGVVVPDKSYKFYGDDLLEVYKSKEDAEIAKKSSKTEANLMNGYYLVEVAKKDAYNCDITYATHSEMGFDHLRDNMQKSYENMNQRDPFFCVVDEVDSVLIDEARTPLIISDSAEESNMLYKKFADLVKNLNEEDYLLEEKEHTVSLTDSGIQKMEKWLGVGNLWSDPSFAKYLDRALLATYFYKKDDQYIVHNGEVILVDEFTGRLQPGRRISNGIHQAIEAKENVEIKRESRTLATVTYQNFFRQFPVLSGMTGTALTEAEEFAKIYNLDVVEIPTNKTLVRKDKNDQIYKDEDAKFRAIAEDIKKKHKKGQPILVGTISVDKSEKLGILLKQSGIKHDVLNAKNHATEAKIISRAGEKGAVTISTNMAGRGTDIRLGKGVAELGGLYVIGTERHESRRIDNQLRGRSGRQGDPGMSKFYLALDDEVMRKYGGDKIKFLLSATNIPDDVPFESKFITRTIKAAQRRVEAENFDSRKHLVEFDDVLNRQRTVIYNRRKKIMDLYNEADELYKENKEALDKEVRSSGIAVDEIRLRDYVVGKVKTYVESIAHEETSSDNLTKENIENIFNQLLTITKGEYIEEVVQSKFNTDLNKFLSFLLQNPSKERIIEQLMLIVDEIYDLKEKKEGFMQMRNIEKYVMLETIDRLWIDHLENLEDVRYSAEVMSYGQKDPLHVYQNDGYVLFCELMAGIDIEVAKGVLLHTTKAERVAEKMEMQVGAKQSARMAQEQLEMLFKQAQKRK